MAKMPLHAMRIIDLYNQAADNGEKENAAAIMGAIARLVYEGEFDVRREIKINPNTGEYVTELELYD